MKLATDRTRHLTLDDVRKLANAAAFAHDGGHPLEVQMTLLWTHVEHFTPGKLGRLTTWLFDRIDQRLQDWTGERLRAVWTRENAYRRGHHLHAMLNVPVTLLQRLEGYLREAFGMSPPALRWSYGQFGMKIPSMQAGSLKYLLKHFDHHAIRYVWFESRNIGAELGINHDGTDGAIVGVKRCGTTQNIGPSARRAAGWRELRTIEQLGDALNPERGQRVYQRHRARVCNLQSERPSGASLGDPEDFGPSNTGRPEEQSRGNHDAGSQPRFPRSTRAAAAA